VKRLLLVAGSGRSGTSLLTTIIAQLGFHIPQPEVQPDETNPMGFGEPQWVVDVHSGLLRRANVHASDARPDAWSATASMCLDERNVTAVHNWLQRRFTENDNVIVKDPRLLWFVPLWVRVGMACEARVDILTTLRHPAEVVRSKSRWYSRMDLSEANRLAGWLNTMLFTERGTRNHHRVFVPFDGLLDDWTQQIGRISETLDLPILVNARARAQAAADAMVNRSLHRSRASWDDLDAPEEFLELADEVWSDLLHLMSHDPDPASFQRLDKHRERYMGLYHAAESVAQSSASASVRPAQRQMAQYRHRETDLREQMGSLKAECERLQAENIQLHRSAKRGLASPRPDAAFVRLARRVPPPVRALVPHRFRRAVMDRFRP
jgi:hypothetical protein